MLLEGLRVGQHAPRVCRQRAVCSCSSPCRIQLCMCFRNVPHCAQGTPTMQQCTCHTAGRPNIQQGLLLAREHSTAVTTIELPGGMAPHLHRYAVVEVAKAKASILLRDSDAMQAHVTHGAPEVDVARKGIRLGNRTGRMRSRRSKVPTCGG